MKSIQMLVMLFIGMMSFTVTGASVTNPQQKQKTDFVQRLDTQSIVSQKTSFDVVFVSKDSYYNIECNYACNHLCFKTITNLLASVDDVGLSFYNYEKALSKIYEYKPLQRIENQKPISELSYQGIRCCANHMSGQVGTLPLPPPPKG